MTPTPGNLTITTVNIGAPDPIALARFYEELLGWEIAVEHAVSCGARLADYQPQDDVRVCLDPVGHPFCLWLG